MMNLMIISFCAFCWDRAFTTRPKVIAIS